MKELSIIIVTYLSDLFIEQCVESIYRHNDLSQDSVEIIIVDNSPAPSDLNSKIEKNYPNVNLLINNKNIGFGYANNIGSNIASGDILLFLNPDTKFIEPVFKKIVDLFKKDRNIGAVGCTLIDADEKNVNSYGYFPEKWNVFTSFVDHFLCKVIGYVPSKDIYPWGANLFVRQNDFVRVGKFDEKIFLFHEEADLCKRLCPQSVKIISKKIMHHEGHGATKFNPMRFDMWLESLIQYHVKYDLNIKKTLKSYRKTLLLAYIKDNILRKRNRNTLKMINKLKEIEISLSQ